MTAGLVACSPARQQDAAVTPPLAYGSRRSRLISALSDKSHLEEVSLGDDEQLRLTMWIDANAPYHDRFVNKRAKPHAYDLAADGKLRESLLAIHAKRCAPCHQPDEVTRLDWIDIRRPARSLFLSAPLSAEAGGQGQCRPAIYATTEDADYQAALKLVIDAVEETWSRPRRDVQSLERDDLLVNRLSNDLNNGLGPSAKVHAAK
jgi:hypothetical protein